MMKSQEARIRRESMIGKLDELGFAKIEQMQTICDLKGYRNASRILKELEEQKYIGSTLKDGYKVYYVANKGRETIGSNSEPRTGQMEHTLMRNNLYISLGMPDSWQTEVPIQLDKNEQIVVDALYMKGNEYHFVEVDYHTSMKRNQEKIERFAKLKRLVFKQFNHNPTIIFYTVSKARKERLEGWMQDYGVKGKVYV